MVSAFETQVMKRGTPINPGHKLLLPGQYPNGDPILSVLCKRSYSIVAGAICTRADEDAPITPGDVPWDAPQNSSIRFESDYIPYKLATDVVLDGHAYAPGGRACEEMSASLRIENAVKTLAVVGDRQALYNPGGKPTFTDPNLFLKVRLSYERAYGGTDVFSDLNNVFTYPRNPYGRGFVVANARSSVDKLPLPNLESLAHRLSPDNICVNDYYMRWQDQPMPVGFGWFPKTWLPRASLAGVMPGDKAFEQEMRSVYEKLLPTDQQAAYRQAKLPDMDFRFFNGASEGQVLPYLQGGERIDTENLSIEGRLAFQLPTERPSISIDIGDGHCKPSVELHTVMIHLDNKRLDMVWRGAIPYPGMDWLPQMKKLEIEIQ